MMGGGGGFDVPGKGGGGALGGVMSEDDLLDPRGMSEFGRCTGFKGCLRRFTSSGFDDCGVDDSVVWEAGLRPLGLKAVGGFGADEMGGRGGEACDVSGSERYDESRSAPVSMPPPVLLSFGIPTPANIPPS